MLSILVNNIIKVGIRRDAINRIDYRQLLTLNIRLMELIQFTLSGMLIAIALTMLLGTILTPSPLQGVTIPLMALTLLGTIYMAREAYKEYKQYKEQKNGTD